MMQSSSRLRISAACLLAIAASAARGADTPTPDVQAAIVKIFTIHNSPDYYNPWSMRGPFSTTGSGCIIKGRRILTNAHVVSDRTFIQVRRYGQAHRLPARVVAIAHAADLALLTVDDDTFFEGIAPLELGDLPYLQQEVLVYGFPLGGDTLSITKGVVSRVEHQVYSHSSTPFLAVQIDAAVNPGNSGGPALSANRIVGVTMQGISQADNIGYIIPPPIIRHFLDDLEDGHYDGFPSIGVVMQGMESPALKACYRVPDKDGGMLVTDVLPGSPASGSLQPGDVLLEVEGHPVADDGTIEFRPRERTSVAYLIQDHQIGDELALRILRAGQPLALRLKLGRPLEKDRLVRLENYDRVPTYFIYGGLVFCPLTLSLLQAWGPNWADAAPEDLVSRLGYNYVSPDQNEVVLLLKVLAADVNAGYHPVANWTVTRVNGQPISNLRDLVRHVETNTASAYVTFENEQGGKIVLDRTQAGAARAALLDTYRIREDRSPDLVRP